MHWFLSSSQVAGGQARHVLANDKEANYKEGCILVIGKRIIVNHQKHKFFFLDLFVLVRCVNSISKDHNNLCKVSIFILIQPLWQ